MSPPRPCKHEHVSITRCKELGMQPKIYQRRTIDGVGEITSHSWTCLMKNQTHREALTWAKTILEITNEKAYPCSLRLFLLFEKRSSLVAFGRFMVVFGRFWSLAASLPKSN